MSLAVVFLHRVFGTIPIPLPPSSVGCQLWRVINVPSCSVSPHPHRNTTHPPDVEEEGKSQKLLERDLVTLLTDPGIFPDLLPISFTLHKP